VQLWLRDEGTKTRLEKTPANEFELYFVSAKRLNTAAMW
jgi:hypothetical protein